MCGIAALLCTPGDSLDSDAIVRMTEAVAHRGPDGAGVAYLRLDSEGINDEGNAGKPGWSVALGHRRLAILDLSDAGHQPMRYGSQLWLTYNGEIYNYRELRLQLEALGHRFESQTDTEVVLAAYAEWGSDCVRRFRGMWALVIIDGRRRVAVLSRDRLGIKPLYYMRAERMWAVVSEIKQLRHAPNMRLRAKRRAVLDYLAAGYEDTSQTFFEDVHCVPAGSFIEVRLDDLRPSDPVGYWHPERVSACVTDRNEAARAFVDVLRESVGFHLRSDVPVGCALSGGIDSSSIAALVQELGGGRKEEGATATLQAFTATYPGDPVDERAYADLAAAAIGATPHYVTPAAETFVGEFDRFTWIHDEPVGSFAQYAAYCVSRITREAGVPVTLNGQGGDELLCGYWQTYAMYLRDLWRAKHVGKLAAHVLGSLTPWGNPAMPQQLPWLARRYWEKRRALKGAAEGATQDSDQISRVLGMSAQERRVFDIREMYLPRLLKWDDRNFMAFSVEGRYPLLDHEVIELSLSFTPEALCSKGWTKEPLRRGMTGQVPAEILRRREKVGFEAPIDRWLAGPLLPQLTESLAASDSPLWQFTERERLEALIPLLGDDTSRSEAGHALFRAFAADRWLRIMVEGEAVEGPAGSEVVPSASSDTSG